MTSQTMKIRYYTTPEADAGLVRGWLDDHVVGVKPRQFYASFVNWCIRVAQRSKDPNTRYKDENARARDQEVFAALRVYPAKTAKFIEAMELYRAHSFHDGDLCNGPANAENPSEFTVSEAQKRVYENVFSQAERKQLEQMKGVPAPPSSGAGRKARQERKKQGRLERKMGGLRLGGADGGDGEVPGGEEEGGAAGEGGSGPRAMPGLGDGAALAFRPKNMGGVGLGGGGGDDGLVPGDEEEGGAAVEGGGGPMAMPGLVDGVALAIRPKNMGGVGLGGGGGDDGLVPGDEEEGAAATEGGGGPTAVPGPGEEVVLAMRPR